MRSEDRALAGVAVVLGLCTLILVGLVVRRDLLARDRPSVPTLSSEEWQDLIQRGHEVGNPDAEHTILVFTDYECSFCRGFESILQEVLRNHASDVRVVYRHFPLRAIHTHADAAAMAVECAAAQQVFESYHRALFQRPGHLARLSWLQTAKEAGVPDSAEFQRCIAEREYESRITEDVLTADRLGFTSTPTVYLDGSRFARVPTVAVLEEQLRGKK